MNYSRLPFEQYFIDNSCGMNDQKIRNKVEYKTIYYEYRKHRFDACYCVLFDKERNCIQIHFQGTSTPKQLAANFIFPDEYYDEFIHNGVVIRLRTHEGWGAMYKALKEHVRNDYLKLKEEHKDAFVEVIGWSLGSAMAQLCAQDLFYKYNEKSHVFTYGSVKVWYGQDEGMKNYLKGCYEECYNFCDNNDIVSYLVPLPRYFHLRKVKVKQDKFCITRLFKPMKYHCEYYKKELYSAI